MTFGDYKLINEVFMDNFEEADIVMGPLETSAKADVPNANSGSLVLVHVTDNTSEPSGKSSVAKAGSLDKIASWNFALKCIEIELFLGINDRVRFLLFDY